MLVELDRRSAIVTGPRVLVALERTGARWMWHEHRRGGLVRTVRVHPDDLADVLAALEVDGQLVELVDRYGRLAPVGGLLGAELGRVA